MSKEFLKNLDLINGSPIFPGRTLIIFDEIQECNAALNTLKYFCETAPEYHIACAGSLLGIKISKPASFPVGKVEFSIDISDDVYRVPVGIGRRKSCPIY